MTISENKKEILLDLLTKLDDRISNLSHMIEDNESINDETFMEIDKYIGSHIESVISEFRNEIYFS